MSAHGIAAPRRFSTRVDAARAGSRAARRAGGGPRRELEHRRGRSARSGRRAGPPRRARSRAGRSRRTRRAPSRAAARLARSMRQPREGDVEQRGLAELGAGQARLRRSRRGAARPSALEVGEVGAASDRVAEVQIAQPRARQRPAQRGSRRASGSAPRSGPSPAARRPRSGSRPPARPPRAARSSSGTRAPARPQPVHYDSSSLSRSRSSVSFSSSSAAPRQQQPRLEARTPCPPASGSARCRRPASRSA